MEPGRAWHRCRSSTHQSRNSMLKHLAVLAIGLTMCSGAALAQTNTSNAPAATSAKLTQFQSGQWRGSKLKGLNVYNNNNEKIGDINELVVDSSGKIDAVVI